MALDVSALNDFNNETAGKIVLDTVFVGNTAEYVSIQDGIKHQEPLNLISVDPYFQGGDTVTNPSGSAEFTQRDITVTKRTAFDQWNLQTITTKYLGVSELPAGSYEETIKLLNNLTDDLVKKAQQTNDDFIWNAVDGEVFAGSSVTAAGDGFKQIISGSTSGVNVPTGAGTGSMAADTAYEQLIDIYEALDNNVKDAEDLTVFCGVPVFTRIVNGLTTQNLFHFDPTSVSKRKGMYEVGLPGFPNVKIVGGWGLRDSERVVMGPASDMVIGTDLEGDTKNFQLWYDINTDTLRYRLRNKLGAQIGHPEYFVSNDLD